MKTNRIYLRRWLTAVQVLVALASISLAADDWPQWLGPHRDGISAEKGLLTTWPAKAGPPLVWDREVGEVSGIEIDVASVDGQRVPATAAAVLYRVAQAAVHNVVKHAQARHVDLHLTADKADAVLEVIDDGRGFDVADAERRRPGMGLFTMRERVVLAGGRFDVQSVPGSGTRIIAAVPLTDRLNDNNMGASK